MSHWTRGLWAVWALLALTACRDSPAEVVGKASEAAAGGDLVAVQGYFSNSALHRLERRWDQEQRSRAEGWQELSEKLVFDRKPLEVKSEALAGDFARVLTVAGAEERDFYLRKEDGRWRLEPGAAPRFGRAQASAAATAPPSEAPSAKP